MPTSSLLLLMPCGKRYLFPITSLLLLELSSLGLSLVTGTAVSLLCRQPRLQTSTSHILLLVQVIAFPTRKSFGSHKEYFYFNLFAVNAVSNFKVTFCVLRREKGIARETFFEGGVSNLPLRHMKMQILSKWH